MNPYLIPLLSGFIAGVVLELDFIFFLCDSIRMEGCDVPETYDTFSDIASACPDTNTDIILHYYIPFGVVGLSAIRGFKVGISVGELAIPLAIIGLCLGYKVAALCFPVVRELFNYKRGSSWRIKVRKSLSGVLQLFLIMSVLYLPLFLETLGGNETANDYEFYFIDLIFIMIFAAIVHPFVRKNRKQPSDTVEDKNNPQE